MMTTPPAIPEVNRRACARAKIVMFRTNPARRAFCPHGGDERLTVAEPCCEGWFASDPVMIESSTLRAPLLLVSLMMASSGATAGQPCRPRRAAACRHGRPRRHRRATAERGCRHRLEHHHRDRARHVQSGRDALHKRHVHARRRPRRDSQPQRRRAGRQRDDRGDRRRRAVRYLGRRERARRHDREPDHSRRLLPRDHAERRRAIAAHPQRAAGERRTAIVKSSPDGAGGGVDTASWSTR